MAQPILTWSLDWGNNTAQKLSGKTYTHPNGQEINCSSVGVTFNSSVGFKKFYATAVKDGRDYGFVDDVLVDIDGENPTGIQLYTLTDRPAATDFSFNINASDLLTTGDGIYRIGLYVQDVNNVWNYEYFFVPVGNDRFQLSDGDILQTPVII